MTTKLSINEAEQAWADARARIDGSIVAGSIVYYDDNMSLYYVGPVDDLADLADLMADDDEAVARDAYSHWCAGTSHGDGYATMDEATAAAEAAAGKLVPSKI